MLFGELGGQRSCSDSRGVGSPGRRKVLFYPMDMMPKPFQHNTMHQTSQRATDLFMISGSAIERVFVTQTMTIFNALPSWTRACHGGSHRVGRTFSPCRCERVGVPSTLILLREGSSAAESDPKCRKGESLAYLEGLIHRRFSYHGS